MMHNSAQRPDDARNLAEGSPGPAEEVEPNIPSKRTDIPAVNDMEAAKHAAETGLVTMVNISGEGRDDEDSQDASLTTDETKSAPDAQSQGRLNLNRPPVVLIIEDTTELAEVIQATLERMDMHSVHETHGSRALQRFDEVKPDIVLLDISLPDMTGWEIMDFMKHATEQGNQNSGMPIVIVITAYNDPANRLVGKLQGVQSYLIKPFTSDEIERTVTQAITSATQ